MLSWIFYGRSVSNGASEESKKTNIVAAIASGRPLSTGLELTSYFAEGATHSFGGG